MVIYNDYIYVCGQYYGTSKFGNYTLAGPGGVFVAKYNLDGEVVWAKQLVQTESYYSPAVNGMSIDAKGNITINAWYGKGKVLIGTDSLKQPLNEWGDILLLNFTTNGDIRWYKCIQSTGAKSSYDITSNYRGDIFIAGNFKDSLFIDSIKIKSKEVSDGFVVKFDANGKTGWLNTFQGKSYVKALHVNNAGHLFVGGDFENYLITPKGTLAGAGTISRVFIIKYTEEGTINWQKEYGDTGEAFLTALRSDGNNILIGGYYFYDLTLCDSPYHSTAGDDMFLEKLDSEGNCLWGKGISSEGPFETITGDIISDQYGNSYFTGRFNGTVTFDKYSIPSPGPGYFTFYVKYDATGNVRTLSRSSGIFGKGIVLDYDQNIYVLANSDDFSSDEHLVLCKFKNKHPDCISHFTSIYDSTRNNYQITIDSAASTATSYFWNFGDGSFSNQKKPTHTYAKDSVYSLCLKIGTAKGDSCQYCAFIGTEAKGHSGFTISILSTIGIDEFSSATNFIVYPNPSAGVLTVEVEKFENKQLKVYNVLGECILQQAVSASNFQIDLSNQINGIYLLQLETGGISLSKRVIIDK